MCNKCGGSNYCNADCNNSGFGQDYIWIILVVIIILFCFGGMNTGNDCCSNNCC
ncbi:MAG: hypothetical protein R3Y12_07625 [Clostridia bacterium]